MTRVLACLLILLPLAVSAEPLEEPWRLYADAWEASLRGEATKRDALLDELRARFPTHEAAERAATAQSLLPPPSDTRTGHGDLARILRDESVQPIARGELVMIQTLAGIAGGLEVCGALECVDVRQNVVAALLGGGAGFGASLYLSHDGMTPGHTLATNSGTLWGAANAGLLSLALGSNARWTSGLLLGGQLGGTALGHFVWSKFEPGAGDVALANSGGMWTLALTFLIQNATGVSLSDSGRYGSLLAALDVGLVAGGLLSNYLPMSRSRSLVIDAGGIVGMLVGFAAATLIESGAPSERLLSGLGAIGATGGLLAAGFFTTEWDFDVLAGARFALAPTDGGVAFVAGVNF